MPNWQQDLPHLHDEAWKALGGKHYQGDQSLGHLNHRSGIYVLLH